MVAKGANLGGEVDIVNANFADPTMPVGLQNGNGVLKLTTDRLNIASFEGTVGGGKVTMQGGVQYRPNLLFALAMAAKDIRMLYPQGMRENIDANIRLDGTTTNASAGRNSGSDESLLHAGLQSDQHRRSALRRSRGTAFAGIHAEPQAQSRRSTPPAI